MQNKSAAVERRLSDPDYQSWLVRVCIAQVFALFVVIAAFVCHDAYVWTHPPKPVYIAFGKNITAQEVEGLANPLLDNSDLLQWSVKWLMAPFSLNYHDYPSLMTEAGKHYTRAGWKTLVDAYLSSGNFEKMKSGYLTCYAVPRRAAVVTQTRVVDGHRVYDVRVPIEQTCENVDVHNHALLMINASVIRVADQDHPDGLAIDRLGAKPE